MGFIRSLFTWWDEPTLAVRLLTRLRGECVGTDDCGNRYFVDRKGSRRWVLYEGQVEASKIPPEWNAWLQRTTDSPPVSSEERHSWQKKHVANATGTPEAYRPPGTLTENSSTEPELAKYKPWQPE